ncbi:Hypothetical predicted protein [Mytilus galloprovincialis]|uniref:Uncharacterized protein n=1 Tax=Mytilus galloprovincialis TaxID=29158 RepID=A0A8B6G6X4_MYTGA|nr:Hypothetical predicted protein [Mytilus galloprovincialis]
MAKSYDETFRKATSVETQDQTSSYRHSRLFQLHTTLMMLCSESSNNLQLVKDNSAVPINDFTGMLSSSSIQSENSTNTDSQGPMLAVFQPPMSLDPNINTNSDEPKFLDIIKVDSPSLMWLRRRRQEPVGGQELRLIRAPREDVQQPQPVVRNVRRRPQADAD